MQINSDNCLNQILSESDMRLFWQMMQKLLAVVNVGGGGGYGACFFTYRYSDRLPICPSAPAAANEVFI